MPTIASAPIISGSSAATRLRKKSSESRKRSGKASISARCRSDSTCLLTCSWAIAGPPTSTPGRPASSLLDRFGGVLPRLVVGRRQGDGEVGRVAVAGDEVARAGVVVAGHRGDVVALAQLALRPRSTRARVAGCGDRRVLEQDDHRGVAVARPPRAALRPGRSRCRGRRRRRGRAGRRREPPSAPAKRKKTIASRPTRRAWPSARRARASNISGSFRLRARRDSSAAARSRSHHSAAHSLNSIPKRRTSRGSCRRSTLRGLRPIGLDLAQRARPCGGGRRAMSRRVARRLARAGGRRRRRASASPRGASRRSAGGSPSQACSASRPSAVSS